MNAATEPRGRPLEERLLLVDPQAHRGAGAVGEARIGGLPALLRPGDVAVVNDAATFPASFRTHDPEGSALELRLVAPTGAAGADGAWSAVLFGAGDWRARTEDRPPPPRVPPGTVLHLGGGLRATVERVSDSSARLVDLRFDRGGAALWTALYGQGRPVQYSYLKRPLDLGEIQTAYAERPWAAEMPSAGRPLRWSVLLELRRRGVHVARLTHAAGLSATGDPALDAALPLAERFDIPAETVLEIAAARAGGGRVLAVGTTVVRALEGCAALHGGALVAGPGVTDLVLHAGYRPRVTDGLLTGLHEPSASHFRLLEAFAPPALLARGWALAEAHGYVCHEFGDSALVLPGVVQSPRDVDRQFGASTASGSVR